MDLVKVTIRPARKKEVELATSVFGIGWECIEYETYSGIYIILFKFFKKSLKRVDRGDRGPKMSNFIDNCSPIPSMKSMKCSYNLYSSTWLYARIHSTCFMVWIFV